MITLSQSPGAVEETIGGAINQHRKSSSSDTILLPIAPPLPKTKSAENINQEVPVNILKAFFISSLQRIPGMPDLILLSKHSLAKGTNPEFVSP